MIKGLYTSALGLAVQNKRQEAVANNLSNANTVGYKKDTVIAGAFPDMLVRLLKDSANPKAPVVGNLSMGVRVEDIVTDHSKGVIRESGNPYEMALQSEGYFVISTPFGERYTRSGEFKLDAEGRLVTSDGYPVMGQNGEIVLTGNDVVVAEDGLIFCDGKEVDRFRIVTLGGEVIKEGSSLLRATETQELDNPVIAQGFLEESNANALEEMVNMITVMRAYESNQKLVQIQDSTLDKAVNEVGRV